MSRVPVYTYCHNILRGWGYLCEARIFIGVIIVRPSTKRTRFSITAKKNLNKSSAKPFHVSLQGLIKVGIFRH